MGSRRHVFFCCLSLLLLVGEFQSTATVYTTNQNNNKCQLLSEDTVEFTTDIVKNGVTYSDVQITINTFRGYKCRQAEDLSNSCKGTHISSSNFFENDDSDTYSGTWLKNICRPTSTVHVEETVEVDVGGSLTSVEVEWSNITECSCETIV